MKAPSPVALPALGVYVHLPWCVRKCPYCDFNSHVAPTLLPQQQYVDALMRDLDSAAGAIATRPVSSIFFGGGTPSLFDGAAIATILSGLKERLNVAANAEVTLEANPGTVEAGRFESFRHAGVNRLSLGAQSFDDRALQALGRIHSAAEIYQAVRDAKQAGFANINIDLMYGLPSQTTAKALADVDIALQQGVTHLSHYQLTLEPNTQFFRNPPQLPDEDTLLSMERACHPRLSAAGFERYEVSAFARDTRQARHNLHYWCFGDYLGLGAGAHSKLTQGGRQQRLARRPNPASYMRHAGSPQAFAESRYLDSEDLKFEFMLNRLRLTAPFEAAEFEQATGLPFEAVRGNLEALRTEGLMLGTPAGWSPSPRGRDLLNNVIGRFLPQRSDLCTTAPQAAEK